MVSIDLYLITQHARETVRERLTQDRIKLRNLGIHPGVVDTMDGQHTGTKSDDWSDKSASPGWVNRFQGSHLYCVPKSRKHSSKKVYGNIHIITQVSFTLKGPCYV